MKKFVRFCTLVLITTLFFSCGNQKTFLSFSAMDTYMTIQAYGSKAEKAVNMAKERITEIENTISTTSTLSNVHNINSNKSGTPIYAESDTLKLTEYTMSFAQLTDGVFNPVLYPVTSAWGFTTGNYTVPSDSKLKELLALTDYSKIQIDNNYIRIEPGMALDFGAVGKGYAGDEAIKILREKKVKSALLDLGGNIQALGTKPDGSEWNVGIKSPWTGQPAASIRISDKAVITSGGYERFFKADDGNEYIHIMDSKTGYPVNNGTASVTIVTEAGLYGDALSTAMFAMGLEKACEFWKQHMDYEMIIFTENQELYFTEGLVNNLNVISEFSSINIIRK